MPKRKKSDIDGGTITNFYDVLPDQFKSKIKNPNKHLHGLDLPFRMLVCAPSGSGKTNFALNLLALFSAGEGTFSEIRILTKNANEKLYDEFCKYSEGKKFASVKGIVLMDLFNKFKYV